MSAAPKRGLGRGLGALLGDAAPSGFEEAPGTREIPVERIRPNPHQPRKRFDPDALGELQASIAQHGVLVPIMVRERDGYYELIAGERRWRASAALQRTAIPAIVRSGDDSDDFEIAIVENLQRVDLNPLEEASGIADLIEKRGYTQDQAAQRLGKSRPAVTNALRLLTLGDAVKALVAQGSLSAGHARALLGAPPHVQTALAQRAARDGMSVRTLERIVAALESPGTRKTAPPRSISPDDRAFEDRLRLRLGAPVSLRRGRAGGAIEIRFAGDADLLRIGDLLLDQHD